jgi:hypothetical protein
MSIQQLEKKNKQNFTQKIEQYASVYTYTMHLKYAEQKPKLYKA